MNSETQAKTERPSRLKRTASLLLQLLIIALITGLLVEGGFRILEKGANSKFYYKGSGGLWIDDARWGWKPAPGPFKMGTSEFQVTGDVNDMFMNQPPIDIAGDAARTRVMVLGDSHTFATGVSREETWANVLEQRLNAAAAKSFRVYNAATTGYNMHQYLLRLKDQGPTLKPHYVLVGLSFATDFYDLLTPEHGGWIYGEDKTRDYFDFDEAGNLQERHWEKPSSGLAAGKSSGGMSNTAPQVIRRFLDNFATFRYLRRSKLALAIGSRVRIGGQSLWPNMEVVVEKIPGDKHLYQNRLFEALLLAISKECERQNAKLIVVGIPYLPQVYDDLWDNTFGGNPQFSRTAASDRVSSFCSAKGIPYVDTLPEFKSRYKEVGQWLHHHNDAHPTAEGQVVIADSVLNAAVISQPKPNGG